MLKGEPTNRGAPIFLIKPHVLTPKAPNFFENNNDFSPKNDFFEENIWRILKNFIFFCFHKRLSNRFFGKKLHNLCKICLNEGANTLLLPCHHISTCQFCTICITFCPICRCEIKSVIKVYFS